MNNKLNHFTTGLRRKVGIMHYFVHRYWFRTTLVLIGAYALLHKEVTVGVQYLPSAYSTGVSQSVGYVPPKGREVRQQLFSTDRRKEQKPMTAEELAKFRQRKAYVDRYYEVAQAEMQSSGIPASITLAQGLLESDAGNSPLAQNNNNHFGIKCFSKTCRKGHCSNFSDDTHKDFFRIYPNPQESYRAHSQLLGSKRYQQLFQLDRTDYKGWAHGLKKAGYATDKRYAEKLIQLIEELALYQYD